MTHLDPSTGVPAGWLNSSANEVAATRTSSPGAGADACRGAPAAGVPVASVAPRIAAASRAGYLSRREQGCEDIIVTTDELFCCPSQQRMPWSRPGRQEVTDDFRNRIRSRFATVGGLSDRLTAAFTAGPVRVA